MDEIKKKDQSYYILTDDTTTYIIIRDLKLKQSDIKIKDYKNLTLVFDFENLTKKLEPKKLRDFIDINNKPKNIIIKNCVVQNISNFFENLDLDLDLLYISDELYCMSPNLQILFENVKVKKFVLKKMKINSKFQLNKFLEFILKIGCEKLYLEDIYIELLIKKNKEDKNYNELEQYITFENGAFYIIKNEEKKELNIRKLKMKDCPLFAINDDTFKNINNNKEISIDIDENSLLNPNIILKFKVKEGYSDICFDLDSYKINEDENNDYIKCIEYIFKIIIDNKDNIKFNKIKFKNFDITKYEYITGENLTFIKEKNWIFNKEEEEKKKKFEEFEETIKKKIKNNLDKLSDVKELRFDNCSNHFIQLILLLISNNNKSEYNLDYLKIKKCGKEYLDLTNILSLNIKKFILFDNPLKIDHENENLGKIENLTIKINSLEHYCKSNNLDYYRTIEIIVDLISNENFNKNLCFEMNALPVIMTFLVASKLEQNLNSKNKNIPIYFEFLPENLENEVDESKKMTTIKNGIIKRDQIIKESFKLKGLDEKMTITLKKNNIKNKLENYENYYYMVKTLERGKHLKSDFGRDIFNLSDDYKRFFYYNKINNIKFENCLFSNFASLRLNPNQISETIIDLIRETHKNYSFDMKSLKEIFFKNKFAEDLTFIIKYLSLKDNQVISSDIIEFIKNFGIFLDNLMYLFDRFNKYSNNITLVFHNIKERKEFYCLISILMVILDQKNFEQKTYYFHEKENKFRLPSQKELIKKIGGYFIKKVDENEQEICSTIFNYYYTSDEEKEMFGDFENKKKYITFGSYKFQIDYEFCKEWDIIMK